MKHMLPLLLAMPLTSCLTLRAGWAGEDDTGHGRAWSVSVEATLPWPARTAPSPPAAPEPLESAK